ncbi:hypothetical protein [Streptomyces sp. NPDC012888]|uniref:hypothetical protein n=1 Tax=Streptomyces sp. NPDC012888 TaxID=3364855 RepID=UPI00369D7FDA
MSSLLHAGRRARVLAFFGCLAWLFGLTPPGWQRLLVVALAATAVAFDTYLDEHKPRPARIAGPRFDTAA